jgi:hypothetical protein
MLESAPFIDTIFAKALVVIKSQHPCSSTPPIERVTNLEIVRVLRKLMCMLGADAMQN